MFIDDLQAAKNNIRTQKVKDLLGDKEYDEKSFNYFVDVLNELGESMDLARGIIDISDKDMSIDYVKNTYNRERRIGFILLGNDIDEFEKTDVNSYIDSICVEYAKFIYEVGLINFTNRVRDIANTITDSNSYDYHDVLIAMARSYDKELKNSNFDKTNNHAKKIIAVS